MQCQSDKTVEMPRHLGSFAVLLRNVDCSVERWDVRGITDAWMVSLGKS